MLGNTERHHQEYREREMFFLFHLDLLKNFLMTALGVSPLAFSSLIYLTWVDFDPDQYAPTQAYPCRVDLSPSPSS